MIHHVKGNLLDSNCDYICHQVNCQGVMNSGVAKQIREKWPEVYESYVNFYNKLRKHWNEDQEPRRGRTQDYSAALRNT